MKQLTVLLLVSILPLVAVAQEEWTPASNGVDIYNTNVTTGKVGIGTTTPLEKLHVNGLIFLPPATTTDNNSPGITSQVDYDFLYSTQYLNQNGFGFHNFSDPATGALTTNGTNTYLSGYYGLTFFSKGLPMMRISNNGNVGIGTVRPDYKLTVNGKVKAEEVQVVVDVPADYVFAKNYFLMPLPEVEKFVSSNGHLPGVPGAAELKQNGWDVGAMSNKLLEKVEELTLYVIDLKKENEELKKRLEMLEGK